MKVISQVKRLFRIEEPRDNRYTEEVLQQSNVWIRAVTGGIVITTGLAVCWLAVARTEEVVVVQGKLEPQESVKEVQAPLSGVASRIYIKEGDFVKKGQLLLRLDQASSTQRLDSTERSIAYKSDQLQYKKAEMVKTVEIFKTKSSVLRGNLLLEQKILSRIESLYKSGAISELQFITQKNKVQSATGELLQANLEAKKQASQLNQQISDLETNLQQLAAEKKDAEVTLLYQDIRSPVNGLVFDLKHNAPGSIIQPQSVLMKIVPKDNLIGKVEVPSSKIGFVHPGMDAEVSIDSFPASDFGIIKAKVLQVGSDALPPDPAKGIQVYRFPTTLTLSSQKLKLKGGGSANLASGMSITANIKLRGVSFLSLLFQSLRDKADSLKKI